MAQKSLEERFERLEAAYERLEAVHEIQNVMSRYEYFLSAGKYEDIVGLFAQKTPGVTAEIGSRGVYEGIDGVRKLYPVIHTSTEGDRVGWMAEHDLTTPVIEVAKDGKTAKAIWLAPGVLADTNKETGKRQAWWIWDRDAMHFVKEDGEWKIWHFHVISTFRTPYEDGWVKTPRIEPVAAQGLPKPDRPTTYHQPYNPNIVNKCPLPPEPYETYGDNEPLP